MSSTAPIDLTAAVIIERIESGEYPAEVQQTIAAGYLPLPQEELIAVLAYMATSSETTLAQTARRSLTDLPTRSMVAFASDERVAPEHLARLAGATDDTTILESLIRNRALSDDLVADLAANADAAVQDVVVTNQLRILRSPKILEALLANPRLTPDVRRRALETREEFFEKQPARTVQPQPGIAPVDDEEAVAEDLPLDAIADLLERAKVEDAAEAPKPANAPRELDPNDSIFGRILKMTVAEKVQLAFKCGKTERMLLVRDRNKLVCSAVMRNPRMTETEAESIAGMRNVDEEVLRLVSMRREWTSKYPIVSALARNPKAPVGVVLPLINRLTLRDLKGLKDDKGVSEVVRAMARKLYQQRSLKS